MCENRSERNFVASFKETRWSTRTFVGDDGSGTDDEPEEKYRGMEPNHQNILLGIVHDHYTPDASGEVPMRELYDRYCERNYVTKPFGMPKFLSYLPKHIPAAVPTQKPGGGWVVRGLRPKSLAGKRPLTITISDDEEDAPFYAITCTQCGIVTHCVSGDDVVQAPSAGAAAIEWPCACCGRTALHRTQPDAESAVKRVRAMRAEGYN